MTSKGLKNIGIGLVKDFLNHVKNVGLMYNEYIEVDDLTQNIIVGIVEDFVDFYEKETEDKK